MTIEPERHDLPAGYEHLYSGKVRDLYRTPRGNLLVVASDRISAYDWVLPTPIPDKGAVLTALSKWWFEQLAGVVDNHLVPAEEEAAPESVASRSMVCRALDMYPVECVVRGYLTGSGLVDYRATGEVCGVPLPAGLVDGSQLPRPIFTPATKAALGDHDENVDFDHVVGTVGPDVAAALRDTSLAVYAKADSIARERGIVLADTKFEFGQIAGLPWAEGSGEVILADEVLTPDSSRFWPAEDWQPGRPSGQPSFDKQFVRDWLTSPASGWDKNSDVPPPALPAEVVQATRDRYLEAYRRLTGTDFSA